MNYEMYMQESRILAQMANKLMEIVEQRQQYKDYEGANRLTRTINHLLHDSREAFANAINSERREVSA